MEIEDESLKSFCEYALEGLKKVNLDKKQRYLIDIIKYSLENKYEYIVISKKLEDFIEDLNLSKEDISEYFNNNKEEIEAYVKDFYSVEFCDNEKELMNYIFLVKFKDFNNFLPLGYNIVIDVNKKKYISRNQKEIHSVLEDLKVRRFNNYQLEKLEYKILNKQYITFQNLYCIKDRLEREFYLRFFLRDLGIYKTNNKGISAVKEKKLLNFDFEGANYILEKVAEFDYRKEYYEFEELLLFLFDSDELEKIYADNIAYKIQERIDKKYLDDFNRELERYDFLFDYYSKEYRFLFNKFRVNNTLYKTQKVLREYREEVKEYRELVNTIYSCIDDNRDIFKPLFIDYILNTNYDIVMEDRYNKTEAEKEDFYNYYIVGDDDFFSI